MVEQTSLMNEDAVDPASPPANSPLNEPKLDKDGKPVVEPELGKDGKPVVKPELDKDGKVVKPELDKDGKPIEGGDKDEKSEGAPEKYETFKVPDGMEIDEAKAEAFGEVARDLNLTQEGAQKLVDMYAAEKLKDTEAALEEYDNLLAGWRKATKDDPEIGGAKLTVALSDCKLFVDTFGGKASKFKEALDATGVGNHPEFVRVFSKVGALLREDKIVVSNAQPTPPAKSAAEKIYTSHNE